MNNELQNSHAAPRTSQTSTWDIDASHTAAGFKVRHMMVSSVRGHLGPVTGSVVLDEQDITRSRVEASIDVSGIDTREAKRDEHLRSADFFDAANHPTIAFRSTSVKTTDKGLLLTGELTIRGNTRSISLELEELTKPVVDPWGNVRIGATARGKLNRKDFGLTWNVALEAGGILVGDDVGIELEVELTKRKA